MDKYVLELVREKVRLAAPWYIMCAYAYYKQDDPIVSDETFDKLAIILTKAWDQIDHPNKGWITLDMVKAGTFLGDYPEWIESNLEIVRKEHEQDLRI